MRAGPPRRTKLPAKDRRAVLIGDRPALARALGPPGLAPHSQARQRKVPRSQAPCSQAPCSQVPCSQARLAGRPGRQAKDQCGQGRAPKGSRSPVKTGSGLHRNLDKEAPCLRNNRARKAEDHHGNRVKRAQGLQGSRA